MSEKITFKELVDLIAKQSDQSHSSANSFISELVQIIESGLKTDGQVSISGFGKFELRWMNERLGTNPQTGEEITIPGQNKVVFKPYKALREDVNAPYSHLKSEVINVKKKKSKEVVVPLIRTTGGDESIDDLIFEKEHPYKKSKEDSNAGEPPRPTPFSTAPKQPDPALIREVQDKSTFNWSFAAAGIIALLAFLLLFYLIQRTPESESPSLTTQTEVPVTVEPEPTQIDQTAPEPAQDDQATPEPAQIDQAAPDPQIEAESGVNEMQAEFEFQDYQMNPGESLWSVAASELGNPYLWPLIYHVNRDMLNNPNDIPLATDLDIPIISDPDNLTDYERDQVALGYLDLYEWNRVNNPDEARFFLWAVGVFSTDLLENLPSEVDAEDLAFATSR